MATYGAEGRSVDMPVCANADRSAISRSRIKRDQRFSRRVSPIYSATMIHLRGPFAAVAEAILACPAQLAQPGMTSP